LAWALAALFDLIQTPLCPCDFCSVKWMLVNSVVFVFLLVAVFLVVVKAKNVERTFA
jgi:hypothetical protein